MLILILIDFQYSQKAVFSFVKVSNRQNHSSSGSFPPVKNPPCKIFDSPHTPYLYLENPATYDYKKTRFSVAKEGRTL